MSSFSLSLIRMNVCPVVVRASVAANMYLLSSNLSTLGQEEEQQSKCPMCANYYVLRILLAKILLLLLHGSLMMMIIMANILILRSFLVNM